MSTVAQEYDGGNAGRTGQGSGNTSDRYGEGRDTSSGTDYKSSGTKVSDPILPGTLEACTPPAQVLGTLA